MGRFILDNPDAVRGRRVLDVGSGCGATAIAAMFAGATEVCANDIDTGQCTAQVCLSEIDQVVRSQSKCNLTQTKQVAHRFLKLYFFFKFLK